MLLEKESSLKTILQYCNQFTSTQDFRFVMVKDENGTTVKPCEAITPELVAKAHMCECTGKAAKYGNAISTCYEKVDKGELWVTNEEYDSQVNFCPQCGYEARTKIRNKK